MYIHTSPDGKRYVGITSKKPECRWNNGKGYCENSHFTRAIDKYGWDKFAHEIIATGLSKSEACSMEQDLIAKYQTQNDKCGYNKSSGGEQGSFGVKRTPEQREKMRLAKLGTKHSDETRHKMSMSHKGVAKSREWAQRRSEAQRGKTLSEDCRAKISAAVCSLWSDPEYRAKLVEAHSGANSHRAQAVLCVETGEVFGCIRDACERYGVHSSAVSNVCRGKLKTTGGYHWRYVEKESDIDGSLN